SANGLVVGGAAVTGGDLDLGRTDRLGRVGDERREDRVDAGRLAGEGNLALLCRRAVAARDREAVAAARPEPERGLEFGVGGEGVGVTGGERLSDRAEVRLREHLRERARSRLAGGVALHARPVPCAATPGARR